MSIITARNDVAARLCFHKRVSRILPTGGHAWQGGMCGGGGVWQQGCMAAGMHGRAWRVWWGACVVGGHVWQGACMACMIPPPPPADTMRYGQ